MGGADPINHKRKPGNYLACPDPVGYAHFVDLNEASMSVVPKPVIEPVHQTMYPTLDSLQDVVAFAHSEMPSIDRNVLLRVLGVYHNSLLNQLNNRSIS